MQASSRLRHGLLYDDFDGSSRAVGQRPGRRASCRFHRSTEGRPRRIDSLSFVRGDDDSDDFWSLVSYCRGGGPGHARAVSNGEYDVVYGLVTRAGVKRVYKEYDQVSFHTERSISLLNSLTKGYTRIDDKVSR